MRWSVWIAAALATGGAAWAQAKPDLVIFDEDDAIGAGVYDASFGAMTSPSQLTLGGDKLKIVNGAASSGTQSGLLEWTAAPGGSWELFVASPGWAPRNATGYSNLVFEVNGPGSMPAAGLPRIGLESATDVRTAMLPLTDFLDAGLDGNSNGWQTVVIPLNAFEPFGGFSLSQFKAVRFQQGTAADNVRHTLWFDRMRITAGTGTNSAPPPQPATNVVSRGGDQSIVLHWEPRPGADPSRYNVYKVTSRGVAKVTPAPLDIQSYADVNAANGALSTYFVRGVNADGLESTDSERVTATARPFADESEFLEYVQQTAFDYFWYEANPANGLVRDRSASYAGASIAATGFGLTGIGIAIEHGWITRGAGAERVRRTLRTFWEWPQGPESTGAAGYKGWFYHFLNMETGTRLGNSELSSIDTALLLAGVLYVKEFFTRDELGELEIRDLAQKIFDRVDWLWMANGSDSLSHGWRPESGFLANRWIGYNEAMILYLLGMGATQNAIPAAQWSQWTSGYRWENHYGYEFVVFPPLFGHQYSHCWIDFRGQADEYMRAKASTYFENSRRATLAQREYCIRNPGQFSGYSSNLWGLTACDGPGGTGYRLYAARGAPPAVDDDGTIAPTAAGGSMVFTPAESTAMLRHLYDRYRANVWTGYGFRDAFNLNASWWGADVLGIDQGPILLMIENHRTRHVWKTFMRSAVIRRGLAGAGFKALPGVPVQFKRDAQGLEVSWSSASSRSYQVVYSADLRDWIAAAGLLGSSDGRVAWRDPEVSLLPSGAWTPPMRFYQVQEVGGP